MFYRQVVLVNTTAPTVTITGVYNALSSSFIYFIKQHYNIVCLRSYWRKILFREGCDFFVYLRTTHTHKSKHKTKYCLYYNNSFLVPSLRCRLRVFKSLRTEIVWKKGLMIGFISKLLGIKCYFYSGKAEMELIRFTLLLERKTVKKKDKPLHSLGVF